MNHVFRQGMSDSPGFMMEAELPPHNHGFQVGRCESWGSIPA